jgi:hypothetical protein
MFFTLNSLILVAQRRYFKNSWYRETFGANEHESTHISLWVQYAIISPKGNNTNVVAHKRLRAEITERLRIGNLTHIYQKIVKYGGSLYSATFRRVWCGIQANGHWLS